MTTTNEDTQVLTAFTAKAWIYIIGVQEIFNLTDQNLAIAMGYSRQSWAKYKTDPSLITLSGIAKLEDFVKNKKKLLEAL